MDEQDFHLLNVLGRTKNITHAANELYITQSSVSKRIRQIERELGTTLFLRSRQGIQFTPSGEIVLRHAQNIIHELDAIRQELVTASGAVAGTLRAAVSINYGMYRLPDQLLAFQQRYPLVKTQITAIHSQTVYSQLINNRIDVGILRGEHPDWRGERILLDREHICAIFNKNDADKPLAQLSQIHRQADIDMEREITQWMHENGVHRQKNHIDVNSTSTCMMMVERGLGWGIVPEICLENFHGIVKPLFFKNGEPLLRSTYLMYSPQALELPQVRAFIEIIRESYPSGGVSHA